MVPSTWRYRSPWTQGHAGREGGAVDALYNENDTGWREFAIVDHDDPVAKVREDATSKVGKKVHLFDGGSTGNIVVINWTWSWIENGQERITLGRSVDVVFKRSGEFTVTLTVIDASGNSDYDTMIVDVSEAGGGASGILYPILLAIIIVVVCLVAFYLVRKRA